MTASAPRFVAALLFGLFVLGLTPGVANAAVVAGAAVTFPSPVTVGQTGLSATIELRNNNTPPNTGATNIVCNFGDPLPCPAGNPGITLIPSCGALGALSTCAPAGADPGVFQVSPTAQGVVGTACAGMNFNVTLVDPVFGRLRFTPQPPGAHVTLPGAGSVCRIGFTFDVLKVPTIDQDPGLPGVQTVQIVDNTQRTELASSGRGVGTPTTVLQATPTIATTASPNVTLGGQLTDTTVVSGRVNPVAGATIDFRLYGPGDATCSGAPIFQSLNVPYPVAGGPVSSAAFTPTTAGTYRWIASYSGDANNAAISGACNDANENVTVSAATPTIATTASSNINLGGQLSDTATVSGRVNPQAGATINFRLYGPGDATCSGTPVFQSLNVPYPVAGGPVSSAAFTPTTAGIYRWIASYSGDANNAAVSGACNDANENVTVSAVTPTIATTASPNINLGGQLSDTATISGRVNPQAGATINFRLYGPGDATCSGTPVFQSLNVPYPVAGGPVSSAAFTPTQAGTYRWVASYSGDANNAAVSGACNDANENVTVSAATPTIATTASPNINLGGQLTDTAIVSGRVNPLAGANHRLPALRPGRRHVQRHAGLPVAQCAPTRWRAGR